YRARDPGLILAGFRLRDLAHARLLDTHPGNGRRQIGDGRVESDETDAGRSEQHRQSLHADEREEHDDYRRGADQGSRTQDVEIAFRSPMLPSGVVQHEWRLLATKPMATRGPSN